MQYMEIKQCVGGNIGIIFLPKTPQLFSIKPVFQDKPKNPHIPDESKNGREIHNKENEKVPTTPKKTAALKNQQQTGKM